MAKSEILCPVCKQTALKENGEINRALKNGRAIYCGRKCSEVGRRKEKSLEQKKEEKRLYDIKYREKNREKLKVKKAEYFQRTYDPGKAAIERKKRAAVHAEYCRSPQYKAWKKQYDRKYRAKKEYGEFWECHILTMEIRDASLAQMSDYEIRRVKGTLNKAIERKREYERLKREEPEIGSVGHIE